MKRFFKPDRSGPRRIKATDSDQAGRGQADAFKEIAKGGRYSKDGGELSDEDWNDAVAR